MPGAISSRTKRLQKIAEGRTVSVNRCSWPFYPGSKTKPNTHGIMIREEITKGFVMPVIPGR